MTKSASFGVMQLGIACGVSLALTVDIAIAGAITLVEPIATPWHIASSIMGGGIRRRWRRCGMPA